jgi:serine/threonine protein kinase
MSPEVMRRSRATKQSDLFAVGVMLYKAITGKLPFHPQAIMGYAPFVLSDEGISGHPLELVIRRLLSDPNFAPIRVQREK